MIYIDLIFNLSLLVALSLVSGFIENRLPRHTRWGALLQGILFGGAALLGMMRPIDLGPGLIFDGRSVMVSLCALFFGPWAAFPACLMTITFRMVLGGAGALTGSFVILSSAVIGLMAHFSLKPHVKPPSTWRLYLFGLVVHLAMLALMFTLPQGLSVLTRIGLPVMLLYPLATILVGKILADQVESRQVIAALKKSEERFRDLAEMLPEAVFETDQNLKLTFANRRAFELFGYSVEDLNMGLSGLELITDEDRDRATVNIGKRMKGKDPGTVEYQALRKDGSTFPIFFHANSIIRDGKLLGFRGIAVDITGRKKDEERIARFSRIFEDSLNEIYLFDADSMKFTQVNSAAQQNLGYTMEEFLELTPLDLKPEFTAESFENLVTPLRKGEQRKIFFKTVQKRKDHSLYPVEVHLQLIEHEHQALFVAIISDITEKLKLERQLIQAQKMESIGRLAGGVAHDYNNALSTIIGFTELVMDDVDPAGPLHANLDEVIGAARRATDITRQLLAFARKQTIAPEVLDLNESIEGMLKMLRRLIGEDIYLAWLPASSLWPVKMDPSQIDQIIVNLCINSRDAIDGVGKLTIETGHVTFDKAYCDDHPGFVPGQFVLLAISDDGCGMDKETLGKIFEPFFTTKDVNKGTGLGLAMTYGIVKQNNGFINAYSEPGKGTTIKIYLPRHAGHVTEENDDASDEIDLGHGETVLVVEDEASILKLTCKILVGIGYSVLAANTPNDAITMADTHAGQIDLLIADVVMPEMNGRELAERLQALYPELKCLFMSGYTANVIAHRGVLDKGVHFIQKPFSKKDIAKWVRRALDQRLKADC